MATVIYDDIQDINVSWENYAGSSVERFIKNQLNNKAGYLYRSSSKEGDYYYLYGFTDYEQFEDWAGGSTSVTPLFKVQLPNMENDTFSVGLTTTSSTSKIVNLGEGVKISIRYTSYSTNPTTGVVTDTYNDGTLIIQRSANGSAFTEVGRINISPVAYTATTTYQEVDITNYLVDGDNKIRIRVEDTVNGSVSSNITFQSIINTTLTVENATSISSPLNALQLQYYIQGQVAKTLHITISQGETSQTFTYSIGESTYIEVPYTTPLMSMTLESGIIEVTAWLSVDDTTLVSYNEVNQFYYSDGSETSTVIVLNDVNTSVDNYTNVHLFDFVVYNQTDDVVINITSSDQQTEYLNLVMNDCQVNTLYEVYATLEVESNDDTINAIVSVSSYNYSCSSYTITINNEEKMSPVSGADFILNPKVRNNTEASPARIINSVNNTVVSSTFTGFGFVNDGWVSDDDNIHILRIPAEHTLQIDYDPLDSLNNGTSIEVDFKTYNVFNDNDIIFNFSTTTADNKNLGFVMNPTEAGFYTAEKQTKRDQDVIFQEGERTHLVINIVPNLANSGLNYIRMFINGIMNREIIYSGSDVFKNGTVALRFGSNNCDIDIYGIRIYKSGLSASDVRQNYMSSIPTNEEKVAFKAANNILSSNGTISYDKAKVLYNTLIWTGECPSYSNNRDSYSMGSLAINIIDDAEHSGTISNLRIKGQGSSSKGYWKWNHQYDLNKFDGYTSVFTNNNGDTFSGYALTDDDEEAKKLVAKLNWASSMQSHKLGSTALYNDFWKLIVGGNGITKTSGYEKVRNAVHQKPFMYFIKETASSQPVFYGLVTFGPGKADKPTFGYKSSVFPDYLMLEGSDNGMPLTLRQVPWFDDEVTYNEDEEYYEYAGQGNLDYDLGNQNMLPYFKNAFNFSYLHSPFLAPFTGSISSDADKKYQYWDTETRNVYRYDYINNEWVNAGATKTNDEYDVLNLETQTGLSRSSYSSDSEFQTAVINWRVNNFKEYVGDYYNTTDVIYSMTILKLIGASDNWCKNTYEYLDPVSHKICLAQDDMDTLMLTDNVGRKTKPYYVEEFDLDPDNKPYFNGSDNVFFNLMVLAFESEQKNMMKQIFNTMKNNYDSVQDCLQSYFFDVQEYFPAVAYNETARLLYEQASVAQSNGLYENATPPISQSLGDQLQAEKQWWNRRIPYMQSWSSSDPFYTRSTAEPSIMFRSMTTTGGSNPNYQFTLTPWQYLYPKVGTGQYLSYDSTRVPALSQYTTVNLATDGNTDTYIYGSDYYTNFGEFGGVSLSEAFRLNGKRLLEFSADSREVATYEFRPTSMTVNCPALKKLVLYGCSTLSGSLDLSGCTKLEELDLRGTNLSGVILPESYTLTSAYLPGVTSLSIINCPNLNDLTLETYDNLLTLTTDNSALALQLMEDASDLTSVTLYNINITTDASNVDAVLDVLTNPNGNSTITGSIYLDKELSFTEKNTLEEKYGSSVWISTSAFYISYITSPITSVSLTSSKSTLGSDDSITISVSYSGNDDASYDWTVTSENTLTTTESKTSLVISSGTLSTAEQVTVTYTITKLDSSTVTGTTVINIMPYSFYINGTEISEYSLDMLYGSGDSSVTYSDGWTITCDDAEASFSISSVVVQGGNSSISGNTISSITKTSLSDGGSYTCTVNILIDEITASYSFTITTTLVSMSINSISDIQAINGSGSGSATFTYDSTYASNITVISATVSSGNTNTVSNLSISGCTISVSGYSSSASKVLTLTYKINGGNNCTTTQNFNVAYTAVGGTLVIGYTNLEADDNGYSCNAFSTDDYWPKTNGNYAEQISCTMEYGNDTYNLTWDSTNYQYHYVVDDEDIITFRNSLFIHNSIYDSTLIPIITLVCQHNQDVSYNARFTNNTSLYSLEIYNQPRIATQNLCYNCTNLRSVVIGEGVRIMESYYNCFNNCTSLTSVTFGEDLWYINATFNYCTSLTSITIPDNVTTFACTFKYCSNLSSITLSNNATSIPYECFKYCTSLTSITIPASITSIGDSAFLGCSNLESINALPTTAPSIRYNTFCDVKQNGTLTYPEGSDYSTWLSEESYYLGSYNWNVTIVNDGNLTYYLSTDGTGSVMANSSNIPTGSVSIPSSYSYNGVSYPIVRIKKYGFMNCSSLTSITIPNSIITMEGSCFSSCTSLTAISIPDSVTSIGSSAFQNCTSLINVHIGAGLSCSLSQIGSTLFSNGSLQNIESITVDSNNTVYNDGNGSNCIIETSTNILYIGCKNTTIPSNVTQIGNSAFYNCSGLTSVTFPNTLTTIQSNAFNGCSGLTSISFPDSVTTIGSSAFSECTGLTSISIGSGVTSILSGAYYNPFVKCSNLASITVDSNNTVYNDGNGSNCIIQTSTNKLICGCINTTIPSTVTSIDGASFQGSSITSITIPDSVTSIGQSAFANCTELTSATIGSGCTEINNYAFQYCTKVSVISINCSTAPTIYSATWGQYSSATGYSSETTNVLYVPSDATGYDGDYWNVYLLNSSYGKFTISKTL